jgi:hypothetical protein
VIRIVLLTGNSLMVAASWPSGRRAAACSVTGVLSDLCVEDLAGGALEVDHSLGVVVDLPQRPPAPRRSRGLSM